MDSTKKVTKDLENPKINIKLKLSALWVTVELCYLYGDVIGFFVPGHVEDVLAGKMGPLGPTTQGLLLGVAVLMSVPAVMVFLSLVLKPKVNRWANIIAGVVFTVVMLITLFMDPWHYYLYLGIIEVVITLTIVWQAWYWPSQEVQS